MSQPNGTVYLLDDELEMVQALQRLLSAEGFAVRGFTSPDQFVEAYVPSSLPGCLVLDVAMPEIDGLHFLQRLQQSGILIPIVFLTAHGDIPMSVRAMKMGAVDFLTKPVRASALFQAVRTAFERSAELSRLSDAASRLSLLTRRERQVLELVVTGLLNKQIAAELGTGEQNVKIHRSRMMHKLGVQSLAELVRLADRLKLG